MKTLVIARAGSGPAIDISIKEALRSLVLQEC